MFKKIDGSEYNITDINVPIRITIDIPEVFVNQANGKSFAIIRTHKNQDGSYTSVLLKDLDNDVHTITFETNQFLMYSLVYDLPKGASTSITNPSGVATSDNSAINVYSFLLLSASCMLLIIYLNKKKNI